MSSNNRENDKNRIKKSNIILFFSCVIFMIIGYIICNYNLNNIKDPVERTFYAFTFGMIIGPGSIIISIILCFLTIISGVKNLVKNKDNKKYIKIFVIEIIFLTIGIIKIFPFIINL